MWRNLVTNRFWTYLKITSSALFLKGINTVESTHTKIVDLTKQVKEFQRLSVYLVHTEYVRSQWMVYIGLYTQLIKKAIIGGPHRVAIICMFLTHCLVALFG